MATDVKYFTIDEFCAYYRKKSRSTFYAWKKQGKVKSVLHEGSRLIPISEIERIDQELAEEAKKSA